MAAVGARLAAAAPIASRATRQVTLKVLSLPLPGGSVDGSYRFAFLPAALEATRKGPAAADQDDKASSKRKVESLIDQLMQESPAARSMLQGGRRALLQDAATQAVEFAGRAARHQYVRPALEAFMHSIHSREEVLKALDEAHAHLPNNTPPAQAAAALSDPDASTEEGAPQLEVQLLYPSSLPIAPQGIRDGWQAFLAEGGAHHDRWRMRAMAGLPLTLALGILPGPNVFVYWNLYRLYCHHKAGRGAARQLDHHRQVTSLAQLVVVPDDKLGAAFSTQGPQGLVLHEAALQEAARAWGVQDDVLKMYRRWR